MPNRKNLAGGACPDGSIRIKRRGKSSENGRIKKGLRKEAFFEIFAYQPKPESLTQSEILTPGRDFPSN